MQTVGDNIRAYCAEFKNSFPVILFSVYGLLSLFIWFVFGFLWWRRGRFFPLRERSPFLIHGTMVMMILGSLSVIWPIFWYHATDNLHFCPYNADSNTTVICKVLLMMSQCFVNWSYILRSLRLYFAFNISEKQGMILNRELQNFFKNPILQFIALISITLFYGAFIVYFRNSIWLFVIEVAYYRDSYLDFNLSFFDNFFLVINFFEIAGLILAFYLIKNTWREYRLATELLSLILGSFILQFIALFAFNQYSEDIIVPNYHQVLWILGQHALFFSCSVIYPTMISTRREYPLPPPNVLESDRLILILNEPVYFAAFSNWLQLLSEHDSFKEGKLACHILECYLRIQYKFPFDVGSHQMQAIKEFFAQLYDDLFTNDEIRAIFPADIKKRMDALHNQLDSNQLLGADEESTIPKLINDLFTCAEGILERNFLPQFKKTAVYATLKRRTGLSLEITRNLTKLNMATLPMS